MRRILLSLLMISIWFLGVGAIGWTAATPPSKGGTLPSFNLSIPKSAVEKAYLGISGDGSFKIPQIKAKVVVIEIFSLYCPYCQSVAPGIKEFYTLIENDPNLRGKMKIIGIGAGNTPYEVQVFKDTYATPFPLFPDKDFAIHKALGEVRTPYFIAVKIKDDGSHEVVFSELGAFKGAQSFLDTILAASGLR